jgi:hypothetical protein
VLKRFESLIEKKVTKKGWHISLIDG